MFAAKKKKWIKSKSLTVSVGLFLSSECHPERIPCQDPSRRIFRLSSSSAAKDLGEKCLLEDDGQGLAQDDTRGQAL